MKNNSEIVPEHYHFQLDLAVRDYELDLLGIVNNAVYLNYLEHTRHVFLKTIDIDFAQIAEAGYHLVVTRSEVDYKLSLRSGDKFVVKLALKRLGKLRFVFYQRIEVYPTMELILQAKITGTSLNAQGRPSLPPGWATILERLEENKHEE